MNMNFTKTAAAISAAFSAATGAAFADQAPAVEDSVVLADIYEEIAASQERLLDFVTAFAEERVATIAEESDLEPAGKIILASR